MATCLAHMPRAMAAIKRPCLPCAWQLTVEQYTTTIKSRSQACLHEPNTRSKQMTWSFRHNMYGQVSQLMCTEAKLQQCTPAS